VRSGTGVHVPTLIKQQAEIFRNESVAQKKPCLVQHSLAAPSVGEFSEISPCYSASGSLAARTSTFSMVGGVAKSSEALAISAAATLPVR
jgi:hypothetical protein